MEKKYSKLKEEIMDLFGEISVEEIISNRPLSYLLNDLTTTLDQISILNNRRLIGGC